MVAITNLTSCTNHHTGGQVKLVKAQSLCRNTSRKVPRHEPSLSMDFLTLPFNFVRVQTMLVRECIV